MSDPKPQSGLDVLTGTDPVKVEFLDGTTESVTVRQLVLAQYGEAARLSEEQDEFGLISLATGLPLLRVKTMKVESYDQVVGRFYGLNSYFFGYLGRRSQMRRALGLGHQAPRSVLPSTLDGSPPPRG